MATSDKQISWNEETDIVVAGFGGAGAIAAMVAKDAGAEVIILEKQSQKKHTPSTMMSGGGLHLANNSGEAAKYFKALAFGIGLPHEYGDPSHVYPRYPVKLIQELTDEWAEGIVDVSNFLRSLGKVNLTEKIPASVYPSFPGAKSYGTVDVEGRGVGLWKLLENAVKQHNITILWEYPAKKLIFSPQREVIGVEARSGNKVINIKAKKAVILATGGFACDEELKQAFLPGWGWTFIGNPGSTGDGLRMGMDAGAALAQMHHCSARISAGGKIADDIGTGVTCRSSEPGRLIVDNYGKRYANEVLTSQDPDRYQFYKQVVIFDTHKLEYPRIPTWLIFDEKVRQKGPLPIMTYGAEVAGIYHWSHDNSAEVAKGWILKGVSIGDLARQISKHRDNNDRMKSENLAETIKRFNEFSRNGKDLDFNRPGETLAQLETPPYYAIPEYPGGPNTEGGLVKNARAQVINVFGKPIARLYAAGEIASSWNFLYQAGGNLAECVICGRSAGKYAALEKSLPRESQ